MVCPRTKDGFDNQVFVAGKQQGKKVVGKACFFYEE